MIVFVVDLKPGMELEADVNGPNGRLLLPSGTVLSEQHLRVFNIWGVSEVDIKEGPLEHGASEDDSMDPVIVKQVFEHAEALFAYADMSVEPVSVLKPVCVRRFEEILMSGGELPDLPSIPDFDCGTPDSPAYVNAASFLDSGVQLSSFPDIYYKIMDALDNPSSSSNTLADIISKDSGLCAKLLTLVNSPLYGFSLPVESLSRAVSLVGTRGLSQLALGVTVMDSFQSMDGKKFSMADFWQHSLACGVFCRILSSLVPGTSQDNCFVSGMLHDLGRLVMLQLAPDEANFSFELSRSKGISLSQAEKNVFGFDHCDLAHSLFILWNFPPGLTETVVGHHGAGPNSLSVESAICSVGDVLAVALQYGSNGGGFVHSPYPGAWDMLGLPDGAVATTILKARRQIDDILTVFGG